MLQRSLRDIGESVAEEVNDARLSADAIDERVREDIRFNKSMTRASRVSVITMAVPGCLRWALQEI